MGKRGNYIDAFVKRMFSRLFVVADFLTYYADAVFVEAIDLKKIKLAPSHYIGQAGDERIVDLVFQCPLKNGSGNLMAVIIFEHQNSSLKEIPLKQIRYISAIWDAEMKESKPLSVPYFIVLRTGNRPHRGPLPMLADVMPKGPDGKALGHIPEIPYKVVDLPAWDFRELVGGTMLRLVLGMLHKMTGGHRDDFPEALLPLLEISDQAQKVELTNELLQFVEKAFAAHNRRLEEAKVNEALKPVYREWERTMIKTLSERKYDEGVARGVAVGKARGKAEGKAEALLGVLLFRFKRVPKRLETAIRQMTDSVALQSWIEFALSCPSLKEFEEELR